MMRVPFIYTASELVKWDASEEYVPGNWRPARISGFSSWRFRHFKMRCRAAWGVFTGRYDALDWEFTQMQGRESIMGFRTGSQYIRMNTEDMIKLGIIVDPAKPPSPSSIALVERRHQCESCGGTVVYVRDAKGSCHDYHFECKVCDWSAKQAPLKRT